MGCYIEWLHVTASRIAQMVLHGKSSMAAVGDLSDDYYSLQDSDSRKWYKQSSLYLDDGFPDFRYHINLSIAS